MFHLNNGIRGDNIFSAILRHEDTQICKPDLLYSALVFPLGIGAINISTGLSLPHDPNPSNPHYFN